jgi:transposase
MHPPVSDTVTIPAHIMEQHDIIQEFRTHKLTLDEACARLRRSERQVYRLAKKVRDGGLMDLIHGNTGKASNRALSEDEEKNIESIVRATYADFGPTLAAEKLDEVHDIKVSVETLRTRMTTWGLWKPKCRKTNGEHREWRERRSLFGELEQFDGCYHAWFEDRAPTCCLLGSIDDATGRITGLLFTDWEGVFPSFAFWGTYLDTHGKPHSIYLDRHSTYKVNAKTMLDDPEARSQFERAMSELGVGVIHAYSPEAKGRIERLFGTLQDRLVKDLRLRGISTREEANRFVEEEFIPAFNAKFAVVPKAEGDAHRPLTEADRTSLDRVFSIRASRTVMNDFTLRYKGRYFQLEKTAIRLVCRKDKVEVEEREDGSIRVYVRGAYLPVSELPERPAKVSDTRKAPKLLAQVKSPWKPAPNHPWRKGLAQERSAAALSVK